MMVDLSSFSDEKFDPKKWINAVCLSRHPQDPLDKNLVDLEMKLQMVSEEIAASLEEQSSAALLRVPRATRDVIRLRDDALSLRSSVASILQKLIKAEGSSAESIATLAKVDTVKRRMEAAYETLQDAAGLTQLSSTVEDVFASGDLPRAAETLANMRHCLSAVGEVAEFANVRKQLEVLEDRLDSMVQPRLMDALTNRKVDVTKDMRGILIRIGRFKSLELHYTKVHLKSIKKLWEEFDLRQQASKLANEKNELEKFSSSHDSQSNSTTFSFSSWLPSFYDELLLYLEQEWKWCALAFPEDYRTLVPKLLIETMTAIGQSFASRVNLATGDIVPETKALSKGVLDILSTDLPKGVKVQTKHLEALIELHNTTGSFAQNIQHLFSNADLTVLLDTLKSIYLPYESFKQRYGQMERVVLSSEIAGLDLRGVTFSRFVGVHGVELSEAVRRMEESIPQVIILLELAVERCINFTGGSEADELILVLDDIMLQYISTLQEILKALRAVCGVDVTVDGVVSKKDLGADRKDGTSHSRKVGFLSNEEEWSFVQATLQILTVADCLSTRRVFLLHSFFLFQRSSSLLHTVAPPHPITVTNPPPHPPATHYSFCHRKPISTTAVKRMLDINLFREDKGNNPEIIRESQRRRFADVNLVDEVIQLDKLWRQKQFELDNLRKDFNKINKEIARLKISGGDASEMIKNTDDNKRLTEEKGTEVKEALTALNAKLEIIGNLVHDSVPISNDEANNKIIRTWGEKRTEPKLRNHVELVELLGIADMEKGANIAGGRGFYLKGDGVLLNQALINFGLQFLKKRGYGALHTPFFMRKDIMAKCAQLAQFDEELYKVTGEGDDKYLIATAEQPLCAYHMDDWIHPSQLPLRYAGYSSCFRKEAGSHGRDTLGIFRVHQFEKVEQFCITSPNVNDSWDMHEEMLKNSEEFYQMLKLPYQIVAIVSGALNDAAAKKYDLEAWFPASNTYRELVSCSNCTDYQSRRLEIRFGQKKSNEQVKQYVHLLNSTLTATERTICCILENYQREDGVDIPEVLQPFMGGETFLQFQKAPAKEVKGKKSKA